MNQNACSFPTRAADQHQSYRSHRHSSGLYLIVLQEWGWVLEMYGFAISCFKEEVGPVDLHLKMMSQPPWDEKMDPYYLLHYTYGNDYTLEGEFTPGKIGAWRFDKRSYSEKPPPRNLGAPPDGMKNELVSGI